MARREPHAPPKTGIAAPVIGAASSEQSQRITRATWSVVTHFEKFAFGIASRFDGVSMIRGMTQFTRTFAALSSRAKLSVRRFTPDLLAEYRKDSSSPWRAASLETLTIAPPFAARIDGTTALLARNADLRFNAIARSKSSEDVSSTAPAMYPPTVFTRTSIRLSRVRISLATRSISPASGTFALRSVTFFPRVPRTFSKYGISRSNRYTATTVAPASAKALHTDEPRYPVPPVTRTTFPFNPPPASGRPSGFMSLAGSDQTGKSGRGDADV